MAVTEDARVWIEDHGRFFSPRELGCTIVGSSTVTVIETEGPSLRLPNDSFVITERGEVPAGKLRRGDHVAYMQRPTLAVDRDASKVRLGEVVGYIAGVGTMHGKTAVVVPPRHDTRGTSTQVVPRLAQTLGSVAPHTKRDDFAGDFVDGDGYDPRRLFQLLASVGVDENVKFAVPAWVEQGSREVIVGYVRGVFSAAAGTKRSIVVRGKPPEWSSRTGEYDEPSEDYEEADIDELWITLPTIHDSRRSHDTRMLADLQLLLLKLGIVSRLHPPNGPLAVAPASLDAFVSTIGCFDPIKETAISVIPRSAFERDGYLRVERISRPRTAVEIFGFPEPVCCYVNGLLIRTPH